MRILPTFPIRESRSIISEEGNEEGNEKEIVLRERVHGPWTEEEENQKAKNGCLLHESEGFLL